MRYRINFGTPVLAASAVMLLGCSPASVPEVTSDELQTFRVDPDWPQVPAQWKLGNVASVAITENDHALVLHRPASIAAEDAEAAAPPVLEFDSEGAFIRAWGGPSEDYEWPLREHGIYVDPKGYIWVGGGNCSPVPDRQLLKFTPEGEFVMQIGRRDSNGGNADTENLYGPTDAAVYAPTNELFVADGYGNNRVIVFDADSGEYKRMWGAFGNTPVDNGHCPNLAPETVTSPGADQFGLVHALRVSDDGIVYVADRVGQRFQTFTVAGEFLKEVALPEQLFGWNLALSSDKEQRFLYVGGEFGISVLDRQSLRFLTTIGGEGVLKPGHQISTDAKGNLYIAYLQHGFQRLLLQPGTDGTNR